MLTLPVDVYRMTGESGYPVPQTSTDGPGETAGVTVRQLFNTGVLTDRPAKGMREQSKANFFKKMSVPESAAMTDL